MACAFFAPRFFDARCTHAFAGAKLRSISDAASENAHFKCALTVDAVKPAKKKRGAQSSQVDVARTSDFLDCSNGYRSEQPVRNVVRRGIKARDLAALSLPADYPLRAALDMCRRGIQELRTLYP